MGVPSFSGTQRQASASPGGESIARCGREPRAPGLQKSNPSRALYHPAGSSRKMAAKRPVFPSATRLTRIGSSCQAARGTFSTWQKKNLGARFARITSSTTVGDGTTNGCPPALCIGCPARRPLRVASRRNYRSHNTYLKSVAMVRLARGRLKTESQIFRNC